MEASQYYLASINMLEPKKFISQLSKQLKRTSTQIPNQAPSLNYLPKNTTIQGIPYPKNKYSQILSKLNSETDLSYTKFKNIRTENLSIFKNLATPSISLPCYIQRFYTYGDFTYQHLLAGLAIVARFYASIGDKSENLCIFKIFGASLFLAHKFIDEYSMWSAKDYGLISGCSASTVLKMEKLLLKVLDFKVFVTQEDIVGLATLVITNQDQQIDDDESEIMSMNDSE